MSRGAVQSMTGFGSAERESGRLRVSVSARSVNHRFLDLVLRLPEELRPLEGDVRSLATDRFARGRIEVKVQIETPAEAPVEVELHRGAAEALAAHVRELVRAGVLEGGLAAGDLLRLPDVVRLRSSAAAWTEEDGVLALAAVGACLDALAEARLAEGERLRSVLDERLAALATWREELDSRREDVRTALFATLSERLQELLGGSGIDERVVVQEAAVLAERSDVREELDRLASHLTAFRECLAEGGAVGRKLDFLAQEVHRELNTLGSKCRDTAMAATVVEAKLACEQIREQVQNLE
ncbi:MAG: YicC/YloC family endoribonuclease [Thermoanaerobaculia bacterium]